jgi:hypothetical protein
MIMYGEVVSICLQILTKLVINLGRNNRTSDCKSAYGALPIHQQRNEDFHTMCKTLPEV